jgi:hypothetical protein
VRVAGVAPRILGLDRGDPALQRPTEHAVAQRVLHQVGKQGHDPDAHVALPSLTFDCPDLRLP